MDITPLIETLRQDLTRSAEVGDETVRSAAERLLLALDPALRLTLMDALSQAAAEIGALVPGVTIDVRLNGREPVFVVRPLTGNLTPWRRALRYDSEREFIEAEHAGPFWRKTQRGNGIR